MKVANNALQSNFILLAQVFDKLEKETSRLKMMEILADYFENISPEDVRIAIYLLSGKTGPSFEAVDFGVGEKFVIESLLRIYGGFKVEIEDLYKELGDLGLVAKNIVKDKESSLTLNEVFSYLKTIALTSGPSSQDKKIELLTEMLDRASSLEALYLVRIILGRLRLGAQDATVIEALSFARVKSKDLKPKIERCYNLTSDLGYVAYILFKEGEEALDFVRAIVGNPIRMALAERMENPEEIFNKVGKCIVEPKYDGFRCQVHKIDNKVKIYSRNLEDNTYMFPEIVESTIKFCRAKDCIFEGEAISFDPETLRFMPFQITVQRKRKHNILKVAAKFPLRLEVFDLLYKDGLDITSKPLFERKKLLNDTIVKNETIVISDSYEVDSPEKIKNLFENYVSQGMEGIMIKRLDGVYQAGSRNFNWIKLKRSMKQSILSDTIDAVIMGYFYGKGQRIKLGIGSLLIGLYDPEMDCFETIAKLGSGFTEEEWMELLKNLEEIRTNFKPNNYVSEINPDFWVKPKIVVEVEADEITVSPVHTVGRKGLNKDYLNNLPTGSGFALRFPRAKRIRYDKSPFDSTTPNEIYEMYELSKNKKSKDISENSVNLDSTKLLKKTKMKDKDKTLFD
ncbi:ATP-dependent DNA ligase [Thermodesulfobium acidiphilum]|uniref:ATP-dependent DNA ligase n=1 Tax=Thermodesulfobium acidiphilum TaxID=1794699 RepID=UPI001900ABB7|nr:ATP-dependent DNA ligase [Thermodesulfobium acidiphilum]